MKLIFFSTIIGHLLLWASPVLAKDLQTFVIGVENIDYWPFYQGTNGEYQGFARELFDSFGKLYGHKFVYAPMPIGRLYRSLIQEQTVDFKFPDHPKWRSELKKKYRLHYSWPVVSYIDGMLTKDKDSQIKKFCTITGFTMSGYEDLLSKKNLERRDLYAFADAIDIVNKGHTEGIYGNMRVVQYLCKKKKIPELQLNLNYPMSRSEYHLSTIKHPLVLKDFKDFLDNHQEFVNLLKKKYNLL